MDGALSAAAAEALLCCCPVHRVCGRAQVRLKVGDAHRLHPAMTSSRAWSRLQPLP